MRALEQIILQTIRDNKLFGINEDVAVAVSGGRDSMALLYAMHATKALHGGVLSVLSVDHGLRESSGQDLEFVKAAAKELELPFFGISLGLDSGSNLQERAREARLASLTHHSKGKIALGHHQQDQAETVLYRMLRGSGASGLSGMSIRRDSFIRPMLSASRSMINRYLEYRNIKWREDPGNSDSLRGKIRDLIPQLDLIHGGAVRALAQSADLLSVDDTFLESLCVDRYRLLSHGAGLDLSLFLLEPKALQRRLLRRLCLLNGAPIRLERIEAFIRGLGNGPKREQLPKGFLLEARSGLIFIGGLGYENAR